MRFSFVLPLAFVLAAASVGAQQPAAPVHEAAYAFVAERTRGLPGEVDIEISPLAADNRLPPCAALAAFLPAATRPWGAFSVGVRCEAPTAWTVYLKARVRVEADYLVLARAVRGGQILDAADIEPRRGDVAALPADLLTDPALALGRPARFALAAGRPLQRRMLRVPAAVARNSEVTVVAVGAGFAVSNSGRALNSAAPGERVKVRLSDNRVVVGTARADGKVEIGD